MTGRTIEPTRWVRAAVAHVDAAAVGAPVDRSWRVTLNFHPDRWAGRLLTIEAMARDGVYRSQFETGTSNGGLTAHPGGARWRWEGRLFGGAYDDAPDAERPKYGALDHRRRALGGAPRFGSAYLRLAEPLLDRSTFCFPDSAYSPEHVGTARHCTLTTMADELLARTELQEPEEIDRLDCYVEAHVHGVVDLTTDVEAVVLDPCYRGTSIEASASALGVPVEWHEGRVLSLTELQDRHAYRDPGAVTAAEQIAEDGRLDARIIGDASRAGRHDRQDLKQVWHHVARFGKPVR